MTAPLLDRPPDPTASMSDALSPTGAEARAGLWRAVHRVAAAAFCSDLPPAVVTFTRRRIADHFGVADHLVDVMIITQLLGLTARLTDELANVGAGGTDHEPGAAGSLESDLRRPGDRA